MALPDVLQGLNRGFVTGLLGGPVDLANALLGGVGGDEPFLGSRYIGDKLAAAGLLPKSGNAAAEFVGGLLGPGDALKLAAALPALAKAGKIAEITREFTPGDTTGHLPELLDNPQLQQQYAAMLEPLFTGANGEDKIATALGARATKTLPNAGYYEGRAAPGFASQVAAKMEGNEIAPSSKALLDAIAASHGMLGTQKQSAYNVLTDGVPAAGSPFALQFAAGAPLTGDKMRALQQATHAIDKDVVPMVDPQGARALMFSGTPDERMAQFADVAKQHGASVSAHTFDGNLFPSVDDYGTPPAKFSMQPYIDKVEAAGPEVVSLWDKHVAPIAAPLLDHVTSFAMQHGLTQAPWFAHAMNAIATKGLAGLKAAVKAGIVPAALLGAIGLSADLPPSPAQNPPA